MFHQQDEMVSSYLFSFREASYPLFWISEFCLHSYLAPLKCQQNLGRVDVLLPRIRETLQVLDDSQKFPELCYISVS